MSGQSFDPPPPSASPPPGVRRPLLWKMGARLVSDHRQVRPGVGARPVCRACGERWPCQPQLLGQRGLRASLRAPSAGRGGGRDLPDGRLVEVADGRLVLAPPPSHRHERVLDTVAGRLRRAVPSGAQVWTRRAVRLTGGDATVPDVVVTGAGTPPELTASSVHTAVEVIGADGRFLDRVWKRDRYQAAGIPCFWRVELTSWPGYRGPLPVVVVRVREAGGWREMVAPAGQVHALPVAYGRGPGMVAITVTTRCDPAALIPRHAGSL